jgi:predicted nuclease of predicted toxin-antitoxin system
LRFLVDTQLPKMLARCLEREGYQTEHALDLNLGQSPDNDVWRHAEKIDAVIVSKDEDFAQWVMAGRSGPKVVWLLPVWPDVVSALASGERLVEVF